VKLNYITSTIQLPIGANIDSGAYFSRITGKPIEAEGFMEAETYSYETVD